jgi:hypothetical protein
MGNPVQEKRRNLRTLRAIRELLDLREEVAALRRRLGPDQAKS